MGTSRADTALTQEAGPVLAAQIRAAEMAAKSLLEGVEEVLKETAGVAHHRCCPPLAVSVKESQHAPSGQVRISPNHRKPLGLVPRKRDSMRNSARSKSSYINVLSIPNRILAR